MRSKDVTVLYNVAEEPDRCNSRSPVKAPALSEKAVPNSADTCAVYSRRHMIDSVLIAAHERVSSAKEALAETMDSSME